MRCWLLHMCLLMSVVDSSGQDRMDGHRFIQTAVGTIIPTMSADSKSESVGFPLIEEYDIRTETQRFDLERQEYTLRIKPSTPKIRKAQLALYEQMGNAPDIKSWEDRCERSYDAHRDWLKLYSIRAQISHVSALSSILDDRETVYERLAQANDLNHDRLIKLEIRKGDLRFRLQELELEREYILKKHGLVEVNMDFEGLMTVDEILSALQNRDNSMGDFADHQIAFEKDLLDREISLEEAEKRRLLDFAQLRYEGPHDALLERRISLGLGFNINRSGNRKLKILELQLEKDRLDAELERDKSNLENNLNDIVLDLEKDIASYHNYLNANSDELSVLDKLGSRLSQDINFSPLTLLEIKERSLDNEENAFEMKLRILSDYVKYVYESQVLCKSDPDNILISR